MVVPGPAVQQHLGPINLLVHCLYGTYINWYSSARLHELWNVATSLAAVSNNIVVHQASCFGCYDVVSICNGWIQLREPV